MAGISSISPTSSMLPTSSGSPMQSNFNTTGIPGLGGGYAYPPGSSMTSFMDSINNLVGKAYMADNGQDVITWANGLAAQAKARQQAKLAAAASASTSASATSSPQNLMSLLQTLMGKTTGTSTATTADAQASNSQQMMTILVQFLLMMLGKSS